MAHLNYAKGRDLDHRGTLFSDANTGADHARLAALHLYLTSGRKDVM